MRAEGALVTDIGRKRAQNQDSCFCDEELGLFIVADGMGGHQGGEVASQLAVQTIEQTLRRELKSELKSKPREGNRDPKQCLEESLHLANQLVFARAQETVELHGMGTTTTALLVDEERLLIGHVGDSRCYLLKNGGIWQLTKDHSLVQEKLRAGLIRRDQLASDGAKNVITRSVGFEPQVRVDVYEFPLQVGDLFLICSDGLTGQLSDQKILESLEENFFRPFENGSSPVDLLKKSVSMLVDSANENGGDDNITVALVRISS